MFKIAWNKCQCKDGTEIAYNQTLGKKKNSHLKRNLMNGILMRIQMTNQMRIQMTDQMRIQMINQMRNQMMIQMRKQQKNQKLKNQKLKKNLKLKEN